jgi:pimeloyl-ACP methyl ester carboxylesterase
VFEGSVTAKPSCVQIAEDVLADLDRRLAATRWPDEIDESSWDYGFPLEYLKDLVSYWRTKFRWRQWEERLNALPNFRADIDGLGIHYLHVRGKGPHPLPLLLTHGWPGSVLEFLKIIPLLTDPAAHGEDPADAFDVVAPSLPGYGFSDRPSARGMTSFRIAELWQRLMTELGYERFGAQGGDWGASVTTWLGLAAPERLFAIHLNYIPGSYSPYLGPGARELSELERAFVQERDQWREAEGAYGHIQGTKPQTLAAGLNDSPAGLAAWIVEKFRTWSDCRGEVERRFSKDELLANVTLYWVTQTIGSSIRLYLESRKTPARFDRDERVRVPCAIARFPLEIPMPPREFVERHYNVVRWTEMPSGGHFAAAEEPELLAEDIRAFFRRFRSNS